LQPFPLDGGTAMKKPGPARGKPGGNFFFGPSSMSGYTIQSDVMVKKIPATGADSAQMADVGVVGNRYTLVLRGTTQRLHLESWYAHKERLGDGVPFAWDADAWYTMKLRVDVGEKSAKVQGKVWKRGAPEPEAWTIAVEDPIPCRTGSPGVLYVSHSDAFYDNVTVTPND
jgi:hypothetical protein